MSIETHPVMPPLKKTRRVWVWVILAILICIAALVIYRSWASSQKRAAPQRLGQGEIPVQVTPVKRGDLSYFFNATGDILPLMQIDLFPKVSGYLEKISVHLGDSVQQGQVIAQIDRNDFLYKVHEIEAKVAQAKAALDEIEAGTRSEEIRQAEEAVKQAQSRYDNAKAHRERMEALYQKQIISKKDFDNAETESAVCEAQLVSSQERLKQLREGARREEREASRAKLKEMEAVLLQEQTRLRNTTITAPFQGEITHKYVDAGALVSPSTPLVTLSHTETLKVMANVLERDIALVKIGMKVRIQAEAFPDKTFDGKIIRMNSALDTATRTLQTEIHIPNTGRMLRPGMFAKIEIALSTHTGTLTIPKAALIEEGENHVIFVVENNKALRKAIVTGIEQDDTVEVLQGLQEGDRIVTKGQSSLKDRSAVRVVEGG
jgi:multidrug efflux pump subunit AcrA (membrane-fusion protein)